MAVQRSPFSALVISVSLAIGPCGPSDPQSPSEPDPPTGNQVTGRERIGWDQPGPGAAIVRAYTYFVYVDGVRSALAGADCASTAGAQGFACSAPLPRLTPGQHTLELSAATGGSGAASESLRSAPLVVVMIGSGLTVAATPGDRAATRPERAGSDPLFLPAVDGIGLVAREIAAVALPTALRFAPDGRLFVAEQRGRVRVIVDGQLQDDPALALGDVVVGPTAGLLDLALDPDFDRNHYVYLVYTVPGREGFEKEVARYREVGGRLAERAVLLGGIPATLADDSAGLAFGPDGKLYVATGTPIDVGRLEDPTSLAGQLLRLNSDGTTPRDNPSYSPIVLRWLTQPVAAAWTGEASSLVVVDRAESPAGADTRTPRIVASEGRLSISPAPSAAVGCPNSAIPAFRSDLFVAVPESRALLRVGVDSRSGSGIAGREPLSVRGLGPVAVVACGPDGDLYVATRHSAAGEEGPDRIFRLQPR